MSTQVSHLCSGCSCTSRAARDIMLGAIAAHRGSVRAASSCICRAAVEIHPRTSTCRLGRKTDRAAEQQQPVRFVALQRAQKFRPSRLPPECTSCAAADAQRAHLDGAHDEDLGATPAAAAQPNMIIRSPRFPYPCSKQLHMRIASGHGW